MQTFYDLELQELLSVDNRVKRTEPPATKRDRLSSLLASSKQGYQRYVLRSGRYERQETSPSHKRRLPQGWPVGTWFACVFVGIVLCLNIGFTTYALVHYPPGPNNFGEISSGDCKSIFSTSTGLHVLINVCSSIIVAASNYNMQCLSAPTRAEVDKAHSQGKPLTIGVGSIRNLRFISRRRTFMWVALMVSTLPLHFLWNSAIFTVTGLNEYAGIVVSSDFQETPSNYGMLDCSDEAMTSYQQAHNDSEVYVTCWLLKAAEQRSLTYLSASDCIKRYTSKLETTTYNLIAVMRDEAVQQSNTFTPQATLPVVAYFEPFTYLLKVQLWCQQLCDDWNTPWSQSPWNEPSYPQDWITSPSTWCVTPSNTTNSSSISFSCFSFATNSSVQPLSVNASGEFSTVDTSGYSVSISQPSLVSGSADWTCDPDYLFQHEYSTSAALKNSSHWTILPEHYEIDHCLMSESQQICRLRYSVTILVAVIICNAIKFLVLLFSVLTERPTILATIGDAVASFLDKPDPITRGGCLMTAGNSDIDRGLRASDPSSTSRGLPRKWRTSQFEIWGKGASRITLGIFWVFWIPCIAIGTTFLWEAIDAVGVKNILKAGFGTMQLNTLIQMSGVNGSLSTSLLTITLLVNLPQVLLSTLYFLYNALYTSMVSAYDWSLFGSCRRTLRVTKPIGGQRSTYWLSLPWRFSIPLLGASALMHWLLSQSVFLVIIRIQARDNQLLIGPNDYFPSATPDGFIPNIGYSPLPSTLSVVSGFLMLLVLLRVATWHLKPGVSVAGNSSLAISAACHPPADDVGAARKPLMWGAVRHEDDLGPGHCCFTSFEIERPRDGQMYA